MLTLLVNGERQQLAEGAFGPGAGFEPWVWTPPRSLSNAIAKIVPRSRYIAI